MDRTKINKLIPYHHTKAHTHTHTQTYFMHFMDAVNKSYDKL